MTLPIRISVRVDFDDGSEHTYEVRGPDAVPAPGGFWPEGVVTSDVAQRIEHDRKQTAEIVAQTAEIVSLRAERDRAVRLLDDALFLRMNGERPPGAPHDPKSETWHQWDRDAEAFLRSRLGPASIEADAAPC